MKNILNSVLIFSLTCLFPALFAEDGWIELFDGESFDGWTKRGGDSTFEIQDGTIVGLNGPNHNTFLCTDRNFSDFVLEFEVLLDCPMNSGIQIRSKVRDETHGDKTDDYIYGPQVEIEQSPGESAYIYAERAGGWMTPEEKLITHEVFRNGEWNRYRIVAQGPRIQTWINGKQISDLYDRGIYESHKKGFIGLQVHGTGGRHEPGTLKVAWRNIRIWEITECDWKPLFNGKNLDGWIPKVRGHEVGENPGNIFRAENGILKVSYDAFDEFGDRYGHLFYEEPFSHYKLRFEYRFVGEQAAGGPGWAYRNNGIMIHGQSPASMELLQKFPDSIEVQLLGADKGKERTTGNVCTPGTQFMLEGELIQDHCYKSNSASYAGDQWVKAEIHVYGSDEVIHFINGEEVLRYQNPQFDDGTLLGGGTLSLQAESHGTEFRNIEILEMKN